MPPHHAKRRFWRLCRIYFRRFRVAVWFLVLLLLSGLLYLNQVGLPGFLKKPVLERLRARGLDLQFSRLRLRWYEGLVAENVQVGRADAPLGPRLTLGEVRVPLNLRALVRLRLQLDGLVLRRGRLVWVLAETNQAPSELAIDRIQTDLRFLPNDQWALDNFHAVLAGADIRLSGVVTNASAVRDWKFLRQERAEPAAADVWQARLQRLADTLEQIQFPAAPELRLDVRGDARDVQSFTVRLQVAAPNAQTPWGEVRGGQFSGRILPAGSDRPARGEFTVVAADAQTRWGAITNFVLGVELHAAEKGSPLINGVLRLSAARVRTPWAEAASPRITANWVHALTNPVPLLGECQVQCLDAKTEWGKAGQVKFSAHFAPAAAPQAAGDASWGWWTNLVPYQLDWQASLAQLESPRAVVDEVSCAGAWSAPRLGITNLQARLYGGEVTAQSELDVAGRKLSARLTSDFDPHRIEPLLNEAGREWLEQFGWDKPPRAKANLAVVLPAWTNRHPDWRAEVQPTLFLQGEVDLDQGGTYYGVQNAGQERHSLPFTTARSHFVYSNLCWHLPDLTLTRPEGGLAAEHRADERTRDFYWHLTSTLDLRLLRPFLDAAQQRAFDYVSLTQPPAVELELWGRFHEPDRTGFRGSVALTNFTFRGQSFERLQTALQYTNRVLQFFAPEAEAGMRRASAAGVTADFNAQRVYLTNGYSTVDPLVIAGAIGPHIVRAIEPYQFLQPPSARVYGTIPMYGEEGADLHFDLDGGPFHWWKFKVPHITGQVHWLGDSLTLTNIEADFYQGSAAGAAGFTFRPKLGADFRFRMAVTNVLLEALMAGLADKTNRLEGRLSGNLVVTAANTADWRSVNGHGDLGLRDGLLWDIPLFGIFSPILNGIVPGMGSSRATAATCSFVLTNGVCRTDDLEIRSTAMRLDYRGTVDLEGKVNARVDAELLRNVWLVGPLFSTVFWPVSKMFEYKVTGALADPKMDPVFIIPRLILFPLHPFKTLKGLLPEEPSATQTNAPPPFRQP